jgi:hypothetical protein
MQAATCRNAIIFMLHYTIVDQGKPFYRDAIWFGFTRGGNTDLKSVELRNAIEHLKSFVGLKAYAIYLYEGSLVRIFEGHLHNADGPTTMKSIRLISLLEFHKVT